jgi:hypothetical protein
VRGSGGQKSSADRRLVGDKRGNAAVERDKSGENFRRRVGLKLEELRRWSASSAITCRMS